MDLGVLRAEADLDLPARAEVLRLEVVGDEALDLGRADEAAADPVEFAADEGLGEGERAPAAELPLGVPSRVKTGVERQRPFATTGSPVRVIFPFLTVNWTFRKLPLTDSC